MSHPAAPLVPLAGCQLRRACAVALFGVGPGAECGNDPSGSHVEANMINMSLDLEGATIGELQTFLRAVESTGAKSRTPLQLEGTVLSVRAEAEQARGAAGPLPKVEGDKPLGDQALKSIIDALVNRATGA
ncbi:hypothetical protein CPELA_03365 [Corynebacterium pelargi]|uniref:Uncharacterized protein n=2 Tax=Corynebacterium pelargi TaxID=1471400 RepID=A0A410W7M2_9CORY|nr:hypothetical protein CPELA_03365 [Corynebacterium pelargi]